jgi:hypothetical protein
MKNLLLNNLLLLTILTFLIGCSNGIKVKGKLINALDNKPLSNTSLLINGEGNVETNSDGDYEIGQLQPFQEYNFTIQPTGFTSVNIHTSTQDKGRSIEVEPLLVIPQPPSFGAFSYYLGKYAKIPERQAFRYALEYGKPGEEPDEIAQSGEGRLTAWFLKDESISSLPQITQHVPIVLWHSGSNNSNNYYIGIAPLYQREQIIITGKRFGTIAQAIIPEGWYLGLRDLIVGEYTTYGYAPLNYKNEKWPFQNLQCISGQDFNVIVPGFEPGKYAIIVSDMDWDPNISYGKLNGISPVITSNIPVFEIIKN